MTKAFPTKGMQVAGESEMAQVQATAMQIYGEGRRYALERGVIIADTKFEFRILPGEEAPTVSPDSSRFWPATDWRRENGIVLISNS